MQDSSRTHRIIAAIVSITACMALATVLEGCASTDNSGSTGGTTQQGSADTGSGSQSSGSEAGESSEGGTTSAPEGLSAKDITFDSASGAITLTAVNSSDVNYDTVVYNVYGNYIYSDEGTESIDLDAMLGVVEVRGLAANSSATVSSEDNSALLADKGKGFVSVSNLYCKVNSTTTTTEARQKSEFNLLPSEYSGSITLSGGKIDAVITNKSEYTWSTLAVVYKYLNENGKSTYGQLRGTGLNTAPGAKAEFEEASKLASNTELSIVGVIAVRAD